MAIDFTMIGGATLGMPGVAVPSDPAGPRSTSEVHVLSAHPIYLDHQATTPLDPVVLEAMLPFLSSEFGNASSRTHAFGRNAAEAVECARRRVAALINAAADDLIFTAGATEANVLAIEGAARAEVRRGGRRRRLVSSPLEHASVLACLEDLSRLGFETVWIRPGADGRIQVDDVLAAVTSDTLLVSLMLVNNEIGVINPIAELASALERLAPDVLLHTDAAQACGKVPIDLGRAPIDLMSFSGHKIYGPKGVGALYVRPGRARLDPLMRGGGQERGVRGGTLNVPAIVGFGMACKLARARFEDDGNHVGELTRNLYNALVAGFPALHVNGSMEHRVPGNLSVAFPGVNAEELVSAVGDEVAISLGSACSSGTAATSHVLKGIGLDEELARATIRIGIGRSTTHAEIERAAATILAAAARLRRASAPSFSEAPLRLRTIGTVSNGVSTPEYIGWKQITSRVRLEEPWVTALEGLEHYSHALIVFYMDQVTTCKLTHVPQGRFGDVPAVGMFACRCAYRPNPIGVTVVRLLALNGSELTVEGLDAVDGTPVLDIKPYTPQADVPIGVVKAPDWVDRIVY